ncbi:hypothetical protein N9C10_01525 [Flavobacteriaceae bacterium]|nr:hypothetical protein [Flavobacteriaceae bacterium]
MEYSKDVAKWPIIKVCGQEFQIELLEMANTVTKLNLWDWFKNESPPPQCGYMWWSHPNADIIRENLSNRNVHSGASFAYCMRIMEKIAKEGFNSLKK